MVRPKTEEEIELLRINGDLVSRTLAEVGKIVAPGVTTEKLNEVAETFIRDNGAIPSFKGFEGFPSALCISVNDVVVHGFPSDYVLKEGDIVSVDCGTLYKGYNGDSAYTFPVGEVDAETRKLLDVTKASLYKGIEAAVAGGRTGDIGHAVQTYAESFGFSVVRADGKERAGKRRIRGCLLKLLHIIIFNETAARDSHPESVHAATVKVEDCSHIHKYMQKSRSEQYAIIFEF